MNLLDPQQACDYVNAAARKGPKQMLAALGRVAREQGISGVASRSGSNKRALYRMLSAKGNPVWRKFRPVIPALGMRLKVEVHKGERGEGRGAGAERGWCQMSHCGRCGYVHLSGQCVQSMSPGH